MSTQTQDAWIEHGYGQGKISPGSRPAVLVVDMQYAFTDPEFTSGGAELIERAAVNLAKVLPAARDAGVPVYHTTVQWSSAQDRGLWTIKLPFTAEITPGSRWSQIDERLWDDRDVWLPKLWPSFFHGTPLHSLLTAAQRDTVIVTGCTTSGCCRATTIDAFSCGLRTWVPEDCVGDQGPDAHESNLRDLGRRYAEIVSSQEVLDYFETITDGVVRS